MKDLRKESLLVRNEIVKLLKDNFDLDFRIQFNDLYWKKDNFEVRRLKGWFNIVDYRIDNDKLNEINDYLKKFDFGIDYKVEINNLRVDLKDRERLDNELSLFYIIKITYKGIKSY